MGRACRTPLTLLLGQKVSVGQGVSQGRYWRRKFLGNGQDTYRRSCQTTDSAEDHQIRGQTDFDSPRCFAMEMAFSRILYREGAEKPE